MDNNKFCAICCKEFTKDDPLTSDHIFSSKKRIDIEFRLKNCIEPQVNIHNSCNQIKSDIENRILSNALMAKRFDPKYKNVVKKHITQN